MQADGPAADDVAVDGRETGHVAVAGQLPFVVGAVGREQRVQVGAFGDREHLAQHGLAPGHELVKALDSGPLHVYAAPGLGLGRLSGRHQ